MAGTASGTAATTHKVSTQSAKTASSTANQNAASTNSFVLTFTPPAGFNLPGSSTSGTGSTTGTGATGTTGTGTWQDIGIRAGLVLGGGILVIVGTIKIFSGQPVNVPGTLRRRPGGPSGTPAVQRRSYVETRDVGEPPENVTVRTTPDLAAAAAGGA
jgi:hypothetical protein